MSDKQRLIEAHAEIERLRDLCRVIVENYFQGCNPASATMMRLYRDNEIDQAPKD